MARKKELKPIPAVYMVSLGCPKNLCDTEVILGNLLSKGWAYSYEPDGATLYVINTCAFLKSARDEAESAIAKAGLWKAENPLERKIAVAGCLTEYDVKGRMAAAHPEVDFWIGVDDIANAADIVRREAVPTGTRRFVEEDVAIPRCMATGGYVAYVKIADGCDNCCAYCIIPKLRGRVRSRSVQSIVSEVKWKLSLGAREIILVAQDTTVYGKDRPESKETLATLLRKLDSLPGDFVIRVLYTHPAHYTDEIIDAIANCKKVLKYVDIPVQHISDRILKAMNRHVDAAGTKRLLAKLRERIPGIVLRTTVIVGLPGETAKEFAELREFCREVKFDRIGAFAYSPEPGSPAAKMENQVSESTKRRRLKLLLGELGESFTENPTPAIGSVVELMLDAVTEHVAYGRVLSHDAPDIDIVTAVTGFTQKTLYDDDVFCTASITGYNDGMLQAKFISRGRK